MFFIAMILHVENHYLNIMNQIDLDLKMEENLDLTKSKV